MKIAICISGATRFPHEGFSSLESMILRNNNCDIYIHSYEGPEASELIKIANPKKFLLEDINKKIISISQYAQINKAKETNVENMYMMYWNIYKCMALVNDSYDFIIRTRSDLIYSSPINFVGADPKTIYIPFGGDWRGGLFDMFAAGGPDRMLYYSSLFQHLNEYAEQGIFAHPETMLRHHLLFGRQDSIPVHRFPWGISLIRKNTEQQLIYVNALPLPDDCF
jgi:hypothetical protein